ncbi:MAG: di-trans,poly-cis-decaprenylcistransferase [Gammaproteobacteria bacterium]|nr:MAG: di-trans,poly-cis-decaprenylcistransferase [Gammaproteobacteria bacterium]
MVPKHIAIIMDGNNRWAKQRNLPGSAGHRAGMEAIRNVLEACNEQGVKVLTLFAFSSENWGRPRGEVRYLLSLFIRYLRNETRALHKDGIRIRFIGERFRFSRRLQDLMQEAEELTAGNGDTTLVIAADYGGRWDIASATRRIAERMAAGELCTDDITPALIDEEISLKDLPPPDLCIRTGGDHRVSNFMLWQFAYTELYFAETLWPDFGARDLALALEDFSGRERRFGLREPISDAP